MILVVAVNLPQNILVVGYYYNGIDGDEETVNDHLDRCPGYMDLTNEEEYAIMEETKGESK